MLGRLSVSPTRARQRIAFVELKSADGASAEAIEEFLGRGLEESPAIFLSEAKSHGKSGAWCTVGITANFGDYGAMSASDRAKKLKGRRQALNSVNEAALSLVKMQCLAAFPKE